MANSSPREVKIEPPGLRGVLQELPLFPLRDTVFFPGTLLPLHVFEPRYRQMTEHVIQNHGMMGVVYSPKGEELAPVAGLGQVVHSEELNDGRYHILLQGIARVRLEEKLPQNGLLYRTAKARVLDAHEEEPQNIERELQALHICYLRLLAHDPQCLSVLKDLPERVMKPGLLADVICATILESSACRQEALEELQVSRRLANANEAMAQMLLSQAHPEGGGVH